MTSAFCPAHITCFFRPVYSENVLERGSRGAGIRLSSGTVVHVHEISGSTKVTINGKADEARITRHVLEHMAPGRSFDVAVECSLPLGQGFGMSASGAIASALCMAEITGASRTDAFEAAHVAEVVCGGGLGDVAGLMHEGDVPVRIGAGLPPKGKVTDAGIVFRELTLAVLGDKLSTAEVLGDADKLERVCRAGDSAMDEFTDNTDKDSFFKISRKFSADSGVMGNSVADGTGALMAEGFRASMCMLGNSIFTEASKEETERILRGTGRVFTTSSTDEPARIIRKA
ncbi:MAG: pantothenate kinase [Candidatus Methanoplasma sp.]|jgi:pantoate kinase|nr:pantothenate kinase [Candidatus Methanoplasma sp.]